MSKILIQKESFLPQLQYLKLHMTNVCYKGKPFEAVRVWEFPNVLSEYYEQSLTQGVPI